MKTEYPIIIAENNDDKIPYLVYVPDFDAMTQGVSLSNAMEMAEDLISLVDVDLQDEGKDIPAPSRIENIDVKAAPYHDDGIDVATEIKTLVTVDFDQYRGKLNKAKIRQCSIEDINELGDNDVAPE